jgi:cell division protein FtsI/penicillin-binding protein 2
MRRVFLPILMLAGLLQILQPADAQVPGKRPAPAPKKRKVAVRKPPPVDPTIGDNIDGDDLTVRRAAVEALGAQNGSVVVVDPSNGRVLSIVNQKLAFSSGFTPCSTIKLVTALAALSEHVVERDDTLRLSRYMSFNLTEAITHSNNEYFSELGKRLGFDRVARYAKMMGLGETAGLDIPGEKPGGLPDGPPKAGGMGLLTAYGSGFFVTPLELAALVSAIANGGTLYYLQYPRTSAEMEQFGPKVKRPLELAPNGIDDVKIGMRGAVDHGTARLANYDPNEPLFGKTGTCKDYQAGEFMGWFGSFLDSEPHRLVVVVMLASPLHTVSGPLASAVAGAVYKNLAQQHYTVAGRRTDLPEIITTTITASGPSR